MRTSSMLVECIHCFARMSPSREGICPSCGKNINDTQGVNADLTAVEFVDGEKLPMFCIVCARPAVATVPFEWKAENPDKSKKYWLAYLIGALGGVLALKVGPERWIPRMTLEVPACREHTGDPYLKPLRVYDREHRMQFAVHKDFKALWKRYSGVPPRQSSPSASIS